MKKSSKNLVWDLLLEFIKLGASIMLIVMGSIALFSCSDDIEENCAERYVVNDLIIVDYVESNNTYTLISGDAMTVYSINADRLENELGLNIRLHGYGLNGYNQDITYNEQDYESESDIHRTGYFFIIKHAIIYSNEYYKKVDPIKYHIADGGYNKLFESKQVVPFSTYNYITINDYEPFKIHDQSYIAVGWIKYYTIELYNSSNKNVVKSMFVNIGTTIEKYVSIEQYVIAK